jgi:hypothetical protein
MTLELAYHPNDPVNNFLTINSDDGVSWSENHITPFKPNADFVVRPTGTKYLDGIAFGVYHNASSKLQVALSSTVDSWTAASSVCPGATVSLVEMNGTLHGVIGESNEHFEIVSVFSEDGLTEWTVHHLDQKSAVPPSLAVFGAKLWMAYPKFGGPGLPYLMLSNTSDGLTWSAPVQMTEYATLGPAMASMNGRLYMAFASFDEPYRLLICDSGEGTNWSASREIGGNTSQGAPAMCVHNGRLYVAFISEDSTNRILVTSSSDGHNWTEGYETGQFTRVGGHFSKKHPLSIYSR